MAFGYENFQKQEKITILTFSNTISSFDVFSSYLQYVFRRQVQFV